jgi:hypothetical protein
VHGIDREEAIRYMLTGAAARTEGKAKEALLEKALQNETLPLESKTRLNSALGLAYTFQELNDALYEAEDELETYMAASAQAISRLVLLFCF